MQIPRADEFQNASGFNEAGYTQILRADDTSGFRLFDLY